MARNRVIYQSEALYVSEDILSTTTGRHRQLDRVQSANYNFSISRQDINQYGELARIDSVVLDPPTVNLDFSYYLTDGTNERALGFYVKTGTAAEGNFPSGHMTATSGKNFFIVTTAEGNDHNSNTAIANTKSVIGIGNGFLSDYTLDLAVGSLPTVSVTIEAANIVATGVTGTTSAGISGINPAINPTDGVSYASTGIALPSGASNLGNGGNSVISALRPGDVTLTFGNITGVGSGVIADLANNADGIHIQSASLSIPLSRSPLQRLGTRFPFARTVDFPVSSTLTVNAIVNEITAENLAAVLDSNITTDLTLTIKKPGTSGATNAMIYNIKGAKLDSESFSSSIGSNKTVDLVFSTQIGGPNDTDHGVFVSGIGSSSVF
jgi:hypothetical protein